MKFLVTMNMQSRSGNPTHQVICSFEGINSLDALLAVVNKNDFVIAEEYYKKSDGPLFSVGHIVLNTIHIGKVKVAT